MQWFLIALVNPIAHAFVNHFDKYLISKYFRDVSVGVLILFSALFAIFALPILFFLSPTVFSSVTWSQALILMVNGCLLVVAIMFYLYALESDEASVVAPLFQLIPVFGFIFGFFILGETLEVGQVIPGTIILLGSILLSLELGENGTKFKTKLALLMLGSSLFYGLNAVVFKAVAVELGFVNSLFWDMTGKVVLGLVLFCLIKSYRVHFLDLLKRSRTSLILLNSINEVIGLAGEIALVLAVLFAPVVLVQLVGGLQPLFVFIFGLLITLLFPRFGQESLQTRHLIQKIVGIVVISVGAYYLTI